MNLIPWRSNKNQQANTGDTSSALSLFRSEFDSLVDRFFGSGTFGLADFNWRQMGWGLEVDETDKEVVVKAEAPGFEPNDFDIQVSGQELRITAERKQETKDKKQGDAVVERRLQKFVTLPSRVNAEKVEATFKNGVVEIHLPKLEPANWKRIAIKGG